MLLDYFLPGPALQDYVRNFHIAHFVFGEKEIIPVKAYTPRPGDSIQFFVRDPEFVTYPGENGKKRGNTIIMGPHTSTIQRHVGREFLFFQINFQPGALFRLTGIPSYELTDTYIDAEAVFSKQVRLTNERLKNTSCYDEMVAVGESFLLKLVKQSKKDLHRIDVAAKMLLYSTQPFSLNWLANETCLSEKQFERKFYERNGISLSLFRRVVHFDKAFRMKNSHPEEDWLSIALQCGYYDYQHLVRDYKTFTGLTPTAFFLLDNPEKTFGLHES